MPRPLWSGSLSFGLVNVPVLLTSATRDLSLHFRQLHKKDGAPIEQRRYCSQDDAEVDWEEVGRGFELDDGKQVVLTDEELASVQPRKTRTIEIEAFVDLADVDPILFDHPYFLVPAGDVEGTLRAYRLLVETLGRSDRLALGRFVMRTKEYLAGIRARDGALALTTMRFHDEIRPTKDVPTGGKKPAKARLDEAVALIEALSTDWDPESYTDCYRERLQKVVDAKRKRKKIEAPEPEPEPGPVPDLMEALKASLANVRAGRDLRAEPEPEDDEDEKPAKKGAKKKNKKL
jgi:DNA end-binding protein Ku